LNWIVRIIREGIAQQVGVGVASVYRILKRREWRRSIFNLAMITVCPLNGGNMSSEHAEKPASEDADLKRIIADFGSIQEWKKYSRDSIKDTLTPNLNRMFI